MLRTVGIDIMNVSGTGKIKTEKLQDFFSCFSETDFLLIFIIKKDNLFL